jgi:hypothetical protein
LLALTRIRANGQQTIVVQHMTVSDGGRGAMVGQVKLRGKDGRKESAKGEGQGEK